MAGNAANRVMWVVRNCIGLFTIMAVAGCAPAPPALTLPTFTPTSAMIRLPEVTPTPEPSATQEVTPTAPAIPTAVTDGTVPIVPGPVIDKDNLHLLVPLAEFPMEGGGVAWSPDGQTLAIGMHSSVVLLSPLSGGEMRSFEAPEGTSNEAWRFGAVAFSPDGSQIAGGFNGTVAVWDVATGTLVHEHQGAYWVTSVAYSPDGQWIAAGMDRGGWVVDRETDWTLFEIHADEKVWAVAFSPDSRLLASHGDYGNELYEIDTGSLLHDDLPDGGFQMAFSPDSNMLTGGHEIVDTQTYSVLQRLDSEDADVSSVGFHPSGKLLARGTIDGSIEFFDPMTGESLRFVEGHDDWLSAGLAFSPDGRLLASVGEGAKLRLWGVPLASVSAFTPTRVFAAVPEPMPATTATPTAIAEDALPIVPGPVIDHDNVNRLVALVELPMVAGGVAWSPDGQTLAVGTRHSVALLSPLSGEAVRVYEAPAGTSNNEWQFGAVAFSPDEGEIAAGFGRLVIWDVRSGRLLHNYLAGWVMNVAYSPDGRSFAYSQVFGGKVMERKTGASFLEFSTWGGMVNTAVAFSPDSRLVAGFGIVRPIDDEYGDFMGGSIWETGTGALVREFDSPGGTFLAFSPDGSILVDDYGLVDVDTGERVRVLDCGDFASCRSVAFHPRGDVLAVGLQAGTIRFVDPATGELIGQLAGHADWVRGLAFSPDGRLLASVGEDAMVRLWGVSVEE